jgi:glycosyltransferase involved in cell wall biosynthesis
MGAGAWFFGAPDVGVVFFENTRFAPESLARAAQYRTIVVGSSWNARVLEGLGLDNVRTILQGVDLRRFHPRPGPKLLPGRFVVFSGGKLEHRKGHDLVLAAFRRFRQRHPEALLVTAWQSPWPEKAKTLAQSPHVEGVPERRADGLLDVVGWCARNGLPQGSVVDLGLVPNQAIPDLLSDADCAVFASRYESGTNLPAMECMAMGLPVILSDNTGHQDIIDDTRCYALRRQGPVAAPPGWGGDGWGESDVDELDAALEAIWSDREEAARRGRAAATAMEALSWPGQADQLIETTLGTR